jgi:hypothetical protein
MESFRDLFKKLESLPLPFECGKEINEVDLTLLDADIAGYASRPVRASSFSELDLKGLKACKHDLEIVFPFLTPAEKEYFTVHEQIVTGLIPEVEKLRSVNP